MSRSADNQARLVRAFTAQQRGQLDDAEALYRAVLRTDKSQFDAWHMLGLIRAQRGDFRAARDHLHTALRVRPGSVEALTNLARIESELGEDAAAIETCRKALALNPGFALAHNNLAALLRRQRALPEALLHAERAIAIAPQYADAWSNRGNILLALKRVPEALASYDRALALQPNLAAAHLGRGNVMLELLRFEEALPAFEHALAGNRGSAEAWFGLGLSLREQGRHEEAMKAFDTGAALNPALPYQQGYRVRTRLQICDWTDLAAEAARLITAVRAGAPQAAPYTLIAVDSTPADQLACAKLYMADRHPPSAEPLWRGERYRHDRIRLAYVSADFHNHATALLAAGLFEGHDRTRFDTVAISYGPDREDEMRARLRAAFGRLVDVRTQTDAEIARMLRALEIDIAVDLKGLTGYARPGIFQHRPAPLQVNYLGFPGTMGSSTIDYIIADATVLPPQDAACYSEKVAWLPHSYQVNDSRRVVPDTTPARRELGLPDSGFVFCCFNNSYKITPALFDVWMRLLGRVPGSVLWLLEDNAAATRNLLREAERRGIPGGRLVFAPRTALDEHLARHRHADLFLDTLPYNAHTTASDALWMGVPVVTCAGKAFAGRVGASLLRALGLDELVTDSLAAYESLAMRLADDAPFRAAVNAKLMQNRTRFPLFDTVLFTRHIEQAYAHMQARHERGEPPESFAVSAG